MNLAKTLITRRNLLALIALLAALMVVGSIWDYSISQSLYNESNVFGISLAAYGELPAAIAWLAAGTILIAARNRERKAVSALQVIGGALLVLLGAAMAAFMPSRYLDIPLVIVALIGLAITAVVVWGTLRLTANTDRATLIRVASVLFAVVILEVILINLVKIGWARPRMRMITESDVATFQSWWVIGNDQKAELIAQGMSSDEFKSFPSGHTANGAVAMLLGMLAIIRPRVQKHATKLLWAGASFGLLVGLSRVFIGAHFLTDTIVGFSVSLLVIVVAYRIAFSTMPSTYKGLTA